MTVESDTAKIRPAAASRPASSPISLAPHEKASPMASLILEKLPLGDRFFACAPGRLDVLGGLSEYAGSLIVNLPIQQQACVGVVKLSDGRLQLQSAEAPESEGNGSTSVQLSALMDEGDSSALAARLIAAHPAMDSPASRCILGTLVEMMHGGIIPKSMGGLSIVYRSDVDDLSDGGGDSSLCAATLVAVAGALDQQLEPADAAALCQRVLNVWLDTPIGMGDAACALLGKPNTLAHFRGEPFVPGGSIQIADDVALVGIDTGAANPDTKLKYTRVRTASFMGRALIERILQHEGNNHTDSDGSLSRISVTAYVDRFRDRLPTNLKGQDYLDHFGETGDPLTRIEPDFVYKIRSRTEHHIYEHDRACRFVECLARAARNNDQQPLSEAGELMYASHWSYGQRCGLGCVETDLLVKLLRKHSDQGLVYGAKIGGRGCGGIVAVLLRPCDEAWQAIDGAMNDFQMRMGNKPRLLRGSNAGAMVHGCTKI